MPLRFIYNILVNQLRKLLASAYATSRKSALKSSSSVGPSLTPLQPGPLRSANGNEANLETRKELLTPLWHRDFHLPVPFDRALGTGPTWLPSSNPPAGLLNLAAKLAPLPASAGVFTKKVR